MEVTGRIKLIGETQSFDSGFTKREIVITTSEQYPQDIKIEFVKDKTSILDSYKVGQDVKVGINLRGNEYNEKYYVSLNGWKINANEQQDPQPIVDNSKDLPF